jgi:hypothetical protein
MKHPANEEQQHEEGHGPDPWSYVNRTEDAAASESFNNAEAMTEPSLKSRLVARFGGHEEESNVSIRFRAPVSSN